MKPRGRITERHGETIPAEGAHLGNAPDSETRVEALLRAGFPEEPVPAALEEAQLAAIVEAAGSVVAHGAPTKAPQSAARRRRHFRTPRLAAGMAAAAATLLLLFSGLAAAGTLPSSLQGFASRTAALIGVHVPRPHGSSPEGLTTPSAAATPNARASGDSNHGAAAGPHRTPTPAPRGKSSRARTRLQGQSQHGAQRGKPAAHSPSSNKVAPHPSSGANRGAAHQTSGRIQGGGQPSPPRGSTKPPLPPKRDGSSK